MAITFLDGVAVDGASTFNEQVTIASPTASGGTLIVGRKTGQVNIKSSDDGGGIGGYLIMDSNTNFAAINYYTNQSVVLGYGGGNVGVGDNSPSQKLSVTGNIVATGTVTGTNLIASGTVTGTNLVTTSGNQSIAGIKTFTNDIIARSGGVDGGMKIGGWPQSVNAYGFIGTANMTGLEYCMISDGVDTFIGAGTSGALKLRGPANDSSPSIVIDGSSVTVDDGASVGTGTIRAKYNSSDNSAGITTTVGVKNASQSQNLTLTIKDGVITGVSSDRRLKTNITLIGTSDSGINIYTFEYKYKFSIEGVGLFQGVMSDEVPDHAVGVDENGYDVVDYSVLDVEFKRVSL